ncbi:MAG: ECF transporter S component [Candidatus Marinimicrobia bacterium]|nr:ECF transporter S component [Candidatus Neomarinimicrobiota bacterium]
MDNSERLNYRGTSTTNLAKAAMFTALAVGSGYALILVPNIELITAIVFISGVYLGVSWGIIVGILAEFVFSTLNPMGSGLLFLPLLIAQIVSMAIVGLAGGLLQYVLKIRNWTLTKMIFLGAIGAILTFVYDSLTTLSYPVAAGFEWKQTMVLYLSGIGFTVLHQISNAIIFFMVLPRVFSRID